MLKRKTTNRRREQQTLLEWLAARNWRRISMAATALLLIFGTVSVVTWLLNEPISSITVAGNFRYVSAEEIQRTARRQVAGHGLVSVPVAEVRRRVQRLPWVDTVAIERRWPHGLRLHVTEQLAMARWNVLTLVNRRGELYGGGEIVPDLELPQLSGPEGTSDAVIARFLATRASLAQAGIGVRALAVDARGSWELTLDNAIVVRLGRTQVDARYRRFVATALPAIAARSSEVNYIDMRYTNGFAISWKASPTRLASTEMTGVLKPDA